MDSSSPRASQEPATPGSSGRLTNRSTPQSSLYDPARTSSNPRPALNKKASRSRHANGERAASNRQEAQHDAHHGSGPAGGNHSAQAIRGNTNSIGHNSNGNPDVLNFPHTNGGPNADGLPDVSGDLDGAANHGSGRNDPGSGNGRRPAENGAIPGRVRDCKFYSRRFIELLYELDPPAVDVEVCNEKFPTSRSLRSSLSVFSCSQSTGPINPLKVRETAC